MAIIPRLCGLAAALPLLFDGTGDQSIQDLFGFVLFKEHTSLVPPESPQHRQHLKYCATKVSREPQVGPHEADIRCRTSGSHEFDILAKQRKMKKVCTPRCEHVLQHIGVSLWRVSLPDRDVRGLRREYL